MAKSLCILGEIGILSRKELIAANEVAKQSFVQLKMPYLRCSWCVKALKAYMQSFAVVNQSVSEATKQERTQNLQAKSHVKNVI